MADPSSATTGALPTESSAQKQARLRRERMAAKGGASRLQQITALQGGSLRDVAQDAPPCTKKSVVWDNTSC
jgi:hypothetical protein